MNDLTPDEIALLLAALPSMPRKEQEALLADLDLLDQQNTRARAKTDFMAFCHYVYPGFKEGPHHRHINPLLHEVMEGTQLRLTVSMPPRFGKSETCAFLFVAWYLGHHPSHQIMMVTHTADLSADFGRKVRNLIDSGTYRELFPETVVSRDKSAASNWSTTLGGKYLAIGIGANVAGHGADLLIGDDIVSEQAVLASDPDKTFAQAWEYVQVGPVQRLMPNGRIILIGCMTAETRVLMADGSEKELQHIATGDQIATYDAGSITTSRVTNWIEHLPDYIYKITTTSGRIVRANKRHPFLVDRNGVRAWVRVRDLKVGDCLVEVVQPLDAYDHTKPAAYALPATSESYRLKEKSEPNATPATGESGEVSSAASMGVQTLSQQKGSAILATGRWHGVLERTGLPWSKSAPATSSTGTGFPRRISTLWSSVKGAVAQFAGSPRRSRTHGAAKNQNSTSTTVTTPTESEVFCATTATWLSGTCAQKEFCERLLSTYDATPDAIVEIVEDGFEPVFDLEVERTENFIANGLVSHNTRWGKKDPIGRALAWAENNPESLPWHEVRFPAIMPSGKSLWPEQWPVDQLLAKKAGMFPQFWAAQYMQEPTSEEGALIKREWWRIWEKKDPPPCTLILQSWDTAHGKHDSADPSGVQTWGIWYNPEQEQDQLILLDAWTGRKEFPELKQFALEYYKEWKPDMVIIEKKAAGAPLIQELRKIGIPVDEYTPSRGADKRARINSVADMFASGMVWAPDRRWAHAVIDEIAEFPNGEHDENVDCLVAGTLIETAQGPRPIETLRVGDSVLTHLGFRTVTSAVCTGEQAVWQLQHCKGVLVGTGNHPVHTQAGWKALDKLERTDTIDTVSTTAAASWPLKSTEMTGKRLFLMGTRIRSTQSARILNVLAGGIFCTAIFGHCTMAQFLRGTTSIIRTRTKQTTRWGTWSFFPRATIGESTTAETLSSTTHPSTWPIWKAYGQKRQHGMAPQREGSGTSSTPVPPSTARGLQRHTQELFRKSARACCVERSSWQRQHALCTAAQNASRVWPMLESALQSLRRIGAVVTASLFSTLCRQKQNIVVSNAKVLSIVPLGRQPVYNLAVQEAETYYANGVLVHNCCSQALMRFRAGGLIRLQSDQKDPPVEYRRRTAAYY